jgi:hypothetical protein
VFRTIRIGTAVCLIMLLSCLMSGGAGAQQQDQPKQDIPDAPSASRPPQPFPSTAPTAAPDVPTANEEPPSETNPGKPPSRDVDVKTPPQAAPPLATTTVPPRSQPRTGAEDELYKIVSNVNQVVVPVLVKDDSGRLINGLLPKDFSVYEDGVKQKLNFFSSDPLPLSAAVILDLGMPDKR